MLPTGAAGTPRGRGPPCRVEQALPPLCPQLPARRVGNIHQGTTMSIIYPRHSLLWDGGERIRGGGQRGVQVTPTPRDSGTDTPIPEQRGQGGIKAAIRGAGGGHGRIPRGRRGERDPQKGKPRGWRGHPERANPGTPQRGRQPGPRRAVPSRAGGCRVGAVSLRDGWLQVAAAVSVL